MTKSKKEKSIQFISEQIHLFRCPICHQSVKVIDGKSIVCRNNHTFDVAKQGYVYMMQRAIKSKYKKELFTSRHFIITNTNFFLSLHRMIAQIIGDYFSTVKQVVLFDAGCGEGSHLNKIIELSNLLTIVGVGLDISKETIVEAAKNYEKPIWLVGDLANSPLLDESCDLIVNILSPANYQEFTRILRTNGIVIKVIPRKNYLQELREAFLQDDKNQEVYKKAVHLFQQQFHLIKHERIYEAVPINKDAWRHLITMTPLTWAVSKDQINAFIAKGQTEITVDLDVFIGKKE